MTIRCRFVDSISATPTVRLDLNDTTGASFWLGAGGLQAPPPSLRRAEASTIMRDGGIVAASAYDNRTLTVPLTVTSAASMDARNTLISSLVKELNRESNILEYRPDGSSTSYFFRTFRSPELEPVMWLAKQPESTVQLNLYAEPFAYGARVDQTGVSVKSNPAVTNGCYLDVNGVTGDVATPAYVQLYLATAVVPSPSYLSVRRHGTPASLGFVYQAEAGAGLGAGTTVTGSNDAQASGAGNNTLTTTSAAAKPNFYITPSEGVEIRGTYRVLVRAAKTVFTDEWQLGVSMSSDWSNFNSWSSVVSNVSGYTWTDVGLISLPGAEDAPTGYSGVYPNVSTTIRTYFGSKRVSGTGSLLWDVVVLMPADENLVIFKPTQQFSGTSTSPLVLDGPNDAVYPLASSATFNSTTSRAGSLPLLAPGSNRLFLVENITTATLAGSSTVAVSWWPRFLTV